MPVTNYFFMIKNVFFCEKKSCLSKVYTYVTSTCNRNENCAKKLGIEFLASYSKSKLYNDVN